jgi:dipeptidase D
MVCQKNGGSAHDFDHDPIRCEVDDGWVFAPETTLGADNGLGVALALAVLEDDGLRHPALEVLLTVDEEAGMGGARALLADAVNGRLLINLDTEEWGEIYLGCAGSADVLVDVELPTEARAGTAAADWQAVTVRLGGLIGGHSGIDIHRQRGNAIKLLARVLRGLSRVGLDFRLVALGGGTARNALPREAEAVLLVEDGERLRGEIDALLDVLRDELAGVEQGLRIDLLPASAGERLLTRDAAQTVLALLHTLPQGVRRMSDHLPGVVESSNNVGIFRLDGGRLRVDLMVRSLRAAGVDALCAEIVDLCALAGIEANVTAPAPGWTPNPDSALLALARDVYRQHFGAEAATQVIHAGLECGLFAALWPEMDIVSFGPTIRGAHAPGERVEIESVAKVWRLLTEVLAAIPAPAHDRATVAH